MSLRKQVTFLITHNKSYTHMMMMMIACLVLQTYLASTYLSRVCKKARTSSYKELFRGIEARSSLANKCLDRLLVRNARIVFQSNFYEHPESVLPCMPALQSPFKISISVSKILESELSMPQVCEPT